MSTRAGRRLQASSGEKNTMGGSPIVDQGVSVKLSVVDMLAVTTAACVCVL